MFAELEKKHKTYFYYRHWKNKSCAGFPESFKAYKDAEKIIVSKLMEILKMSDYELRDVLEDYGIGNEIFTDIKKRLEIILSPRKKKELLTGKRLQSENDVGTDLNIEKAVDHLKFAPLKIVEKMLNYMPTCIVLKLTIDKVLGDASSSEESWNIKIITWYKHYLNSIIEEYADMFIPKLIPPNQ